MKWKRAVFQEFLFCVDRAHTYNNTHKVASGSQFAFGRQQGPKKSPHHEPKGALWQTSVVRHSYLLSSAALIPFSTYCRAAANRSRQQEAIAHRETLLAMLWLMHWLRAVGLAYRLVGGHLLGQLRDDRRLLGR